MIPQASAAKETIIYPESDGKPMADNTKQFRWIVTVQGGLDALFADMPNVFVAGDLLWYPVEGRPDIRRAPDAMVVFGRPKGDRGSYRQWEEDDIAPQVVFEILSPGNTTSEMLSKFQFYTEHGVEEYYVYDPDSSGLNGWRRRGAYLEEIARMAGWVSPRLGVRFEVKSGELQLYCPDGEGFATYLELSAQRDRERHRADQAQQHANQAQQHANQAQQHANQAQQHAIQERQRADREQERAARLAAQLRVLGIEPQE